MDFGHKPVVCCNRTRYWYDNSDNDDEKQVHFFQGLLLEAASTGEALVMWAVTFIGRGPVHNNQTVLPRVRNPSNFAHLVVAEVIVTDDHDARVVKHRRSENKGQDPGDKAPKFVF